MKVVLAPDKFKGSLTAAQAALHMRAGILAADPSAAVHTVPIADGGDGTIDAVLTAGFERVRVEASGPLREPITTCYARRGDTAVIELAAVCGLQRLPRPRPMDASSYGLGEVIGQALDAGATKIIVGVGGSASTDGGAGLLQALGARLRGPDGAELSPGGGALVRLASIDLSALRDLSHAEISIAADVGSPLLGPGGAAAIFAPQKGADVEQVDRLEYGLRIFSMLLTDELGRDDTEQPGAGAAGGAGFGLLALGARAWSGADIVLELTGFDAALRGADLVVVGEGSLDRQTLAGKAPAAVARRARQAGVPVVAIVGRSELGRAELAEAGIDEVYPLTDVEPDAERSRLGAGPLVQRQAAIMIRMRRYLS